MARTEPPRRTFITRHDVEDAAAAGRPLVLSGRDLLTDEAAQRARDLGVDVQRQGAERRTAAAPAAGGAAGSGATGNAGSGAGGEQLRRAVRAAVVAELGHEPAGLDAAIDRVLARRA